MRETLRHREAFEYYYGLGKERNIPKVAQEYAVSIAGAKLWSKSFNWQERVEQRDIENSKRLEKKTNDTIVETKANYRKIIKACIAQAVEKIKTGQLSAETIQDIERLIKTDMLLMGEATERNDNKVSVILPRDIDAEKL